MEHLECTSCGGEIEIESGQSIGTCKFCSAKMSVPGSVDRKGKLYNHANKLRRGNEFDRALQIYENILAEEDNEPEAYWGMLLCKYGIEYVEDDKTQSRIPTCHRALNGSILADDLYLSALKYCNEETKQLWKEEARKIDEILAEIVDLSKKQKKYDIFICYKETDDKGLRTEDSVLAQDIYEVLVKEGYSVFFARKTLEYGSAYEPTIFAALNSAKLMFVLGTKGEYFQAVWVRNEWSRYLKITKTHKDKLLIPLYKHIKPEEDLPKEFSHLQAYNLETLGYIQDIKDVAKKYIKPIKIEAPASSPVEKNMLQRGEQELKGGNYQDAFNYFEQVLTINPQNSEAWWGKLRASTQDFKVSRREPLLSKNEDMFKDYALDYCDDEELREKFKERFYIFKKSVYNLNRAHYLKMFKDRHIEEWKYNEKHDHTNSNEDIIQKFQNNRQRWLNETTQLVNKIKEYSLDELEQETKEMMDAFYKYRESFYEMRTQYCNVNTEQGDIDPTRPQNLSQIWKLENKKKKISLAYLITSAVLIILTYVLATYFQDGTANTIEGIEIFKMSIKYCAIPIVMLVYHAIMNKRFNIVKLFTSILLGVIINIIILVLCLGLSEELHYIQTFTTIKKIYISIAALYFLIILIRWILYKNTQKRIQNYQEMLAISDQDITNEINNKFDQLEKECYKCNEYFFDRNFILRYLSY